MEQWEYLHVGLDAGEVETVTSRYGLEGWELVSVLVMRYCRDPRMLIGEALEAERFAAVFKRRIPDFESV
ncbi:hypothetical protein KDA_42380 [Dictyobacter alpinus]|uniref:DUF4177 domain-containing protein n=1 Tax=Dictyobacter alpinus TaxID=2014873 RepID=A0A402BBQ0_9CHLR|nr:hypothetical protein [Dictyobacter alpinus]GCE28754.1 hypothetical protein KDA_42380 [Dictyobacter alpinus]